MTELISVPVSKLSSTTRDIACIFGVVSGDNCVLIDSKYAVNPKQADAVYDAHGQRCDLDTPIPFRLAERSLSRRSTRRRTNEFHT